MKTVPKTYAQEDGHLSNLLVDNCHFVDNIGGGVESYASSNNISNCVFQNTTSDLAGSAIFIGDASHYLTIVGSTFVANTGESAAVSVFITCTHWAAAWPQSLLSGVVKQQPCRGRQCHWHSKTSVYALAGEVHNVFAPWHSMHLHPLPSLHVQRLFTSNVSGDACIAWSCKGR